MSAWASSLTASSNVCDLEIVKRQISRSKNELTLGFSYVPNIPRRALDLLDHLFSPMSFSHLVFSVPILSSSCFFQTSALLYEALMNVAVFTPQFKAISECRQKKFSQAEIENKRSRKAALKPVRQTLVWCGRREVFKRKYVLITTEEG